MINRLATWIGTIIQRIVFWMIWNVPLGRLAPHLLGWAMGAKPVRIDKDGKK